MQLCLTFKATEAAINSPISPQASATVATSRETVRPLELVDARQGVTVRARLPRRRRATPTPQVARSPCHSPSRTTAAAPPQRPLL